MKNNKILDIAVIGGGASGMIAAIMAARTAIENNTKCNITIYESNPRIGKKILVTGNGRCNFTNENISINNFNGESEFAYSVYKLFDNKKTINFFRSIGLLSKADTAGRVYPMSLQASAVLDALRYELIKLDIKEITDTKIVSLSVKNNEFVLNNTYKADKCIIATGGKAAPVQGSDGSGYELTKAFGIKNTDLLPALTPLICENFNKGLKGIRAHGKIVIKAAGKYLGEDSGEIQYTDYGLSGIVSMQLSGFVATAINNGCMDVIAIVDSCPCFSDNELREIIYSIISHNPDLPCEMLLSGIIPKKLSVSFLNDICINQNMPVARLHDAVINKLISCVKAKKYKIKAVKGFNDAQVSTGGIPAFEINKSTMETKKVPGLYICGEIIDVDGNCGGYNLQWAWSSGSVAGISAAGGNAQC